MPLRPRILIGPNTNSGYQSGSTGLIIENAWVRSNTPPLHLTVESFDLFTSLRCARTYFLTRHVE